MWRVAVLFGVVAATPDRLVCNDPRFDPGSTLMGHTLQKGSANFQLDSSIYTRGSTITITFSGLGHGSRVSLRALPKLGYAGDYGLIGDLGSTWTRANGNCPNTVFSARTSAGATLTWTAGQRTYGDVDLTLVWGSSNGVHYDVITLSGPPMPSIVPFPPLQNVDGNPTSTDSHTITRETSTAQLTASPCVAPTDGSYNLPGAPVFIQKIRSKTVTLPAGRCIPCREDHLKECVSARVDCPSVPGALAMQYLFASDDCSGEATVARMPTKFVHCPGPEHYSPDNLDLERFVSKLQRDHPSYFPDEQTARIAIAEYRRMLHIIQKFPDAPAVPSKLVDLAWHEHILDTQTYRHDSQRLFGKYIHHAPSFGDENDDAVKAEKLDMVKQQQDMFELYLELFGDHPNTEVWPLANAVNPVMGAGRLPDCCKADCVRVDCVTCVGCNAVDCGRLGEDMLKAAALTKSHVLPEYFAGYVPLPQDMKVQLASEQTYLCQMAPLAGMTLSWTISGDNIFMQQTLETSVAETWHSVGFTDVEPYDMGYADYIVSFFAGNKTGVRDLYKFDAGNHYPCWDVLTQCSLTGQGGTMDLKAGVSSRQSGVSTSSWYRLLVTDDYKDSPITNTNKEVMFAYGTNDEFTYHGFESRSTCGVNFFTGASSCPPRAQMANFV